MKCICTRIGASLLCLLMMLSFSELSAQTLKVSGTVKDAAGKALPGVTVVVEGTTVGTVTGANGSYSLNVPKTGKTLNFSFIGYQDVTEAIGTRSVIDVSMSESAIEIEGIVSIGYGVKKKTDLTGSVGSVDADEIVAKGTPLLMDALQGAIPGVDIRTSSPRAGATGGSSHSIQIRGQNSLEGGDPLYVVDGIVVDNIDYLNPSDIERVDVLKDASSNAIYGSRGSNGVIMVTTKQAANVKSSFTISYDGSAGYKDIVRTPEYMDIEKWIRYRASAYYSRGGSAATGQTFSISADNTAAVFNGPVSYERYMNGTTFDWTELGYNNSWQTSHTVNASGVSGNTSYTASVGYQGEKGSYKGDEYKRINTRLGFDHKVKEIARLGAQANLSMLNTELGGKRFIHDLKQANPLMIPYQDDGVTPWYQPGGTDATRSDLWKNNTFTNNVNPLNNRDYSSENLRGFRVLANIYAEIMPMKGLSVKTQFSPSLRYSRLGTYYGKETQERNSSGTTMATRTAAGTMQDREYFEYTWDNTVAYAGSTGDHSYDATFVQSLYGTRYEMVKATSNGVTNGNFYNLSSGSDNLANESNYNETMLASFIVRGNYSYKGRYLFTGSVRWDGSSKLAPGYQWRSFPSLAAAWRISEEEFLKPVNWLSNLKLRVSWGNSGNNNNVDAYDTRVRPSIITYYGFGDDVMALGAGPNGLGNNTLTWERTRELDFGLDFGFLNNRIRGTFDFYDKLSKSLIMDQKLPYETGVNNGESSATSNMLVKDNVGSVNNHGVELGITTVNIRKKNVTWSTSFNFSKNWNKIKDLYGQTENDDIANRWFIGYPIKSAYQYAYTGVATREDAKTAWAQALGILEGQAKTAYEEYTKADGTTAYRQASRTIGRSEYPSWIGNFSTSLNVYNFDFSMNIYIDQGRYVASTFYQNTLAVGDRMRQKLDFDYYIPAAENFTAAPNTWKSSKNEAYVYYYDSNGNLTLQNTGNLATGVTGVILPSYIENPNAKWPMANSGGSYFNIGSDDYPFKFTDMSYIKVRNITVGYTFPESITSKIMMKSLRLYFNVMNPFVITKYRGYDPEWGDAGNNQDGPASVTYQFGINAKF